MPRHKQHPITGMPVPPSSNPTLEDITLRDHFAGLAMQAFIGTERVAVTFSAAATTADWAYKYADAMLEARKEA